MKKLLLYVALALLLAACSSPRVVTVTEYHDRVQIDTVTVERERVDSTYQAHYIYLSGDTVHQVDTIYKYRVKYVDKMQTQYVHVCDSIPYPVEVIKEVRKRNAYDQFTSCVFWIMISYLLLRLLLWILKKFYLRR